MSDGVLSADKSKQIERYADTQHIFADTVAPKLLDTEVVGGQLVLTFDEPISASNNASGPLDEQIKVTVDGEPVAISSISDALGVYTVTTNALSTDQLKQGKHNVAIYNVKDEVVNNGNGGNKADYLTGSYEILAGQAPYVQELDEVDFNSFDVDFSETVTNAKVVVKKGNTVFYDSSVSGVSPRIHLPLTALSSQGGTTNLYNDGDKSVQLSVEVTGYKDADQLVGEKYTGTITLNRDADTPTVVSTYTNKITGTTPGNLVVVFDRENLNLKNGSKITVVDAKGTSRTVTPSIISDGTGTDNAVQLAFTSLTATQLKDLAPFTVKFEEGAVSVDTDFANFDGEVGATDASFTDENTNVLYNPTLSTQVLKGDTAAYKVVEAVDNVALTGTNEITITYKSAYEMDSSAAVLSNYTLDGQAINGTITMDDTNKVVVIKLADATFEKNVQKRIVINPNVKTKDGSSVVGNIATKEKYASQLLQITDNVKPTITSAQYLISNTQQTTSKRILVTFSEAVTDESNDGVFDLQFAFGSKILDDSDIASVTADASDDKSLIIELTTGNEVNVTQSGTLSVIAENAKDAAGNVNTAIDFEDTAGNRLDVTSKVTLKGTRLDTAAISQDATNLATAQFEANALTVSYDGTSPTVSLPSATTNGTVAWASDNAAINATTGAVARTAYNPASAANADDVVVNLTPTVTVNGQSAEATAALPVTVQAETLDSGVAGTATATYGLAAVGIGNLDIATESITGLKDSSGNAITATIGDFTATAETIAAGNVTVTGGTDDADETVTISADGEITVSP